MIKKIKNLVIFLSLLVAVFAVAHFALALDVGLDKAAGTGLSAANDPRVIAANIIRIALGFLGLIAISLIIYAGWLWMTAAGEEEKIEKAKKILIGAVIGLVIILSAFAIASFILSKLLGATSGGDGPVCEPACGSGQYCCNSVCSNSPCGGAPPGGGDSFNIRSTVPRNLDTAVIRNVTIKVFFNKTIADTVNQAILDNNLKVEKIATIDPATKAETAVSPASVAGAISLTAERREINFKSDAACGDEKNTPNCLDQWSKFRVTVNGLSGIISVNGQSLNCSAGSNCQFVFFTSDVIDTSGPKAGILPAQICQDDGTLISIPDANLVNGWGRDDIGVADIRFCSEKLGGAENCFADSVKTGGSGQTYLSHSYKYDTSGYNVGDDYIFRAKASDLAGQIDKAEFSAKIRSGHCCNGVKDSGEIDIDCGIDAGCGACEGAACANDMSAPAVCSDNLCASQFCTTQNSDQSACKAAGYAAGANSCCLCQRPPVITGLSPRGGFCADDINKACLADSDCGSGIKCDVSTPNGAVGNFFTIYGRYFGASPGKVFASNGAGGWIQAKLANDPVAGNAQCGNKVWSDSQIIAIVPAGAKSGAVKVENSSGLDTTSDKTGLPDFKINTISRPGLCFLNPNHGKQDEVINYSGIKLLAVSPYFGNLESKVAGLAGNFTDKDGTAKVPNLTTGRTTSFVMKGKTVSNFLNFTKDEEPYKGPFISSFDPQEGAAGQYITINGRGFGNTRGASKVYFGAEGGAVADFNFPQICADSIWSDRQVIVKVPVGLANGNYKITMVIYNEKEKKNWPAIDTSSIQPAVDFKADSALPLKPSLCKINPIIGQVNSQVNLYGEYFGQKDGNSKVRFQFNKDQFGAAITDWGVDDDPKITGLKPDKIITKVPVEAVTGPVRAVKGSPELAGNGINFTVGVCKTKDDCGSGNLCCSVGTPYVGQCKVGDDMQKVCFPEIKACVYEWNFSTAGLSTCSSDQTKCGFSCCNSGQTCEPTGNNGYGKCDNIKCSSYTCGATCCQSGCDNGVCPGQCEVKCNIPNAAIDDPQFNCCNSSGQCNQLTGQCGSCPANKPNQCGNGECCSDVSNCKDTDNNPTTPTACADHPSCAGYGPGQCLVESFLCPNSPGKCSSNAGGSVIDTGVKCGDEECNKLGRCKDKDNNNLCSYNSTLNKCVKTGASCDLTQTVNNINGQEVELKCGAVDGKTVWHYDSRQTCVAGYNKSIDKTKCLGVACQVCSTGFVCEAGASGGSCVSDINICPAGARCDSAKNECVETKPASCECCCNISQNNATTGANPGCCASLTCAGTCGSDSSLTDGPDISDPPDGKGDSNTGFGQCTGCTVKNATGEVDQAASNAKCNCSGTSGKFCSTNEANGLGVCLDCASLAKAAECSSKGAGSCCVDAMNKDACIGKASGREEVTKLELISDFNKDKDFEGWETFDFSEDPSPYSVAGGYLKFDSAESQFGISQAFNFAAGESYRLIVKANSPTAGEGSSYKISLSDSGDSAKPALIKTMPIQDSEKEYAFDFENLSQNYNLMTFYSAGPDSFPAKHNIDYIKIQKKPLIRYCGYYQCQTDDVSAVCSGPVTSSALPTYKTQADCTAKCQAPPQLGQQCTSLGKANGPKTAQDSCDTNQCAGFSCLNEDGSGPTAPNSCGTCCCDPNAKDASGAAFNQCASLNPKLSCYPNKGECSSANRGLCCGCSKDNECGSDNTGCGTSGDRCCQARPRVVEPTVPANVATKVCRNSLIKATFNQAMRISTFKTNIIVVGDYELSPCPAGTQYLTAAYKPTIFVRLKFWLSKIPLVNKLFVAPARALTGNFCTVAGQVSGLVKTGVADAKTTELEFRPKQALEANQKYYVIIKGDADVNDVISNGVLSQEGIGMKAEGYNSENPVRFNGLAFNNAKIWSFTTKEATAANNGICLVDYVAIDPSSYLFSTSVNKPDDDNPADSDNYDKIKDDSDKVFRATAYSSDKQAIAPLEDIYNWRWDWAIDDKSVVKFKNGDQALLDRAEQNIVAQNVKDANTLVHAKTTITQDQVSKSPTTGQVKEAVAPVYVFLCANPWPPFKGDGGWAPWQDRSGNCTVAAGNCSPTNFALYYCRDAGAAGTADDLPAIMSGSTVIRGQENNDILKEFYFFREDLPKATGISLATTTNDEIKQGGRAGLVWNSIDRAKKYTIYYGTAATNLTQSVIVTTNGTEAVPAIISNLTNGVKYYFAVTATYETGAESDYSNKTTAIPADVWSPVTPVLSGSANVTSTADLSWPANQDDTAVYKIYYGATSGSLGASVSLDKNKCANGRCELKINNLNSGTIYYFAISAVDGYKNESNKSDEIDLTIL